jgi:hypothetical protein
MCFSPGSALSRQARQYSFTELIERDLPSGKDGFLSVNSLFGFAVLILRAYTKDRTLPSSYFELESGKVGGISPLPQLRDRLAPLWGKKYLLLIHGSDLRAAAVDMESKFSEAALGAVQVADLRNFAHGRHHWLAKHGDDTGVIFLVSERDARAAKRTSRLLPDTITQATVEVAAVHAIGLLVIDEIQELSNVASGGDKTLLGFFLRLTNTLKIPVLMVGTYKAKAMLREQMRILRRIEGIGLRSWEPLSRTSPEWDTFLNVLWCYQYTKTPTTLTPELSEALFNECQGIPDFAVKLCFLCQDRLIATTNGNSKEKITPRIIKTVATDYLGAARDLLQALRYKDKDKLELLDDVRLPTMAEIAEQRREAIEIMTGFGPRLNSAQAIDNKASGQEHVQNSNTADECQDTSPELECTLAVEKRKPKLTALIGANVDNPDEAYKALAAAGFIKSAGEFAVETA